MMEDSQIRVTYFEDGESRNMLVPRLDMRPETVIEKLRRRFPRRRFTCWCGSGGQPESGEFDSVQGRKAHMPLLASSAGYVEDIMASPVITVSLDASVSDIMKLMQAHNIRHLPVLQNDRLKGIISDRDILGTMSPFIGQGAERSVDAATLRKKAHQFMSRDVVTIEADASLCQASTLMEANRIHCLPVMEGEKLVGIITATDLLSALSVREFSADDG